MSRRQTGVVHANLCGFLSFYGAPHCFGCSRASLCLVHPKLIQAQGVQNQNEGCELIMNLHLETGVLVHRGIQGYGSDCNVAGQSAVEDV